MELTINRIELGALRKPAKPVDDEIVIGKDILELFAGAMYAEPLSVYREYIQNAADSLDEARAAGIKADAEADIRISFDQAERTVKIRDLGAGVPIAQFVRRLTSIGASSKRGTSARGFRGIGRLSGLGYCQELIFRTRAKGDGKVKEMKWDGRVLRERLRSQDFKGSLADLIREVATVGELPGAEYPEHFFEVELRKLLRVKNDVLLNEEAVRAFLSQVAPVPFDPDFKLGSKISGFLESNGVRAPVRIMLEDGNGLVYHRARNSFPISPKVNDEFRDVEFFEHRNSDNEVLAFGWTLDHAYAGAVNRRLGLGGVRLRHGNIQVGDEQILTWLFPEARFVQWAVGDIHIAHAKIIPNGRRDDFEHTAQYSQLHEELRELARKITSVIRERSEQRTKLKKVQLALQYAHAWHDEALRANGVPLAVASAERAAYFVAEAMKAMGKLGDTVPGRDHALELAVRMQAETMKWATSNARRIKDVNAMQKAALLAILRSSVKPEAVMPLAVDVLQAMSKAAKA